MKTLEKIFNGIMLVGLGLMAITAFFTIRHGESNGTRLWLGIGGLLIVLGICAQIIYDALMKKDTLSKGVITTTKFRVVLLALLGIFCIWGLFALYKPAGTWIGLPIFATIVFALLLAAEITELCVNNKNYRTASKQGTPGTFEAYKVLLTKDNRPYLEGVFTSEDGVKLHAVAKEEAYAKNLENRFFNASVNGEEKDGIVVSIVGTIGT